MADPAVSALVRELLARLTSVAVKEFHLLRGFKNDVSALENDFKQIEAVLQDAEQKRTTQKAVEVWLRNLRFASLEVENVLDDISTEAMLQSLHKKIFKTTYSVRRKLMFRFRTAHRVKALRSKLDDIRSKRFELKLSPLDAIVGHVDDVVGCGGEMPDRETGSLIHASVIFGRNEELEMVTQKICNKDIGKYDDGGIRVFGIWGMGGLGKTTLAQLVYNHEMVNQYFELKYWVYVSEKFQVKDIIRKITVPTDELTSLDRLQRSLQDQLRGKKFLIVLDDVWIEEDEKVNWDELSETLRCGAEGSIVVMTTRSQTTSRMMARVPELQHELGCLSEKDSWLLFEKLAFAQGREGDAKSQLEPIGREIVKKCKGLPLALKTLGSLMWSKRSTSDWERVEESNIWELRENNIMPALKLSYDNLLPHLKRCFAYCCLFPKGYNMYKDEVIRLWMSNGFIPPRGETSLFKLAEEIFDCLVWRSFFQVVDKDKKQLIHRYKMHDLMHDMARYVMNGDTLIEGSAKESIINDEVLHLSSFTSPDFLISSTGVGKSKSLRSIFTYGQMSEDHIRQIITHVNLRVLYMPFVKLSKLPESISKLKHLRYLNLSYSDIRILPESIVYLQNLQVLLLFGCWHLFKLPEGLRYMSSLQCLGIDECSSLRYIPPGIKELTNLRILPWFFVGNNEGAKIGELRDQNNLEGMLTIIGLGNVRGLSEARSANLKSKKNLLDLKLDWSRSSGRVSNVKNVCAYDEEVLEGLEPNPCLRKLEISYCLGKIISPSWMVSLRNLAEITISWCDSCEHTPLLGRLPNLRNIVMVGMGSLKCFDDDEDEDIGNANMFPCLQKLHIGMCPRLVSLPSYLPKLQVLDLEDCGNLASLPEGFQSFKDLNELVISNCKHLSERCEKETGADWPKISHIPNIKIYSTSPW